ncbi:Rieske 2Fe-2S domain-containing protein [Actinomadura spongiicola]|uniref:Rieske 2Fe-2S domain-containing protein n=1 Tax=Actinomadura spongiicola TaxID=2303421 RepID=UPI001314B989|nr:Rieske 2Fe-2S domain-containing protein [Actinomadura spongiicola]
MTGRIRVELEWPRHNSVHIGDQTYFCLEREGRVHLIDSICPHRGGPLHLGTVESGRLRCPWHGNTFRVDRLCARSVPSIQRGDQIIAYPSVEPGSSASPSHRIVLAK